MMANAERALIEGAAGRIEVAASMLPAPRAVAVVAHPHPRYGGTMDNKVVTTVARAFGEAGASTFRCLAVIAHAKRTAGDLPLWLAGFSFGGAVAVKASARAEFQHLVLVAPAFRRLTGHGLGAVPDPRDPDLGEVGRHTLANTLVVHGDRDETVLLADSIAWATLREVPIVVVPGADHFFHRRLHILREAVRRWVA